MDVYIKSLGQKETKSSSVITISKLYFFEAITSQRKHMHTHEMFQGCNNS